MLKVAGFKFGIGDVLVPIKNEDDAFYLDEIIINDIHVREFQYGIVDRDGDMWVASPLMIEDRFVLKERE